MQIFIAGFSLLVSVCLLFFIVVLIVAGGDRVFRKGLARLVPGGILSICLAT